MLGASGVAAAAFALLPAVVALLFGLLDAGAHAFLGLSGAFLAVAGALLPGTSGGALPAYRQVAVAVPVAVTLGVARAAAPVAMTVLAARPRRRGNARLALLASIGAAASAASWTGTLITLPGLVAALVLAVAP